MSFLCSLRSLRNDNKLRQFKGVFFLNNDCIFLLPREMVGQTHCHLWWMRKNENGIELLSTQFRKFHVWKIGFCRTLIPLMRWSHDIQTNWINYRIDKNFPNWSRKMYNSGSRIVEPNVKDWIIAFKNVVEQALTWMKMFFKIYIVTLIAAWSCHKRNFL